MRCELVNPTTTYEFGIVNEHMHAWITHHRVDEHYVDDMCGFIFEIGIDCGNMVSAMFDEEMKAKASIVEESYEVIGTTHEVVHDLAVANCQEKDKVIEVFYDNNHSQHSSIKQTPCSGKEGREGRCRERSSH